MNLTRLRHVAAGPDHVSLRGYDIHLLQPVRTVALLRLEDYDQFTIGKARNSHGDLWRFGRYAASV